MTNIADSANGSSTRWVPEGFRFWDLLITASSCAYLMPVHPFISNFTIWLWLVIECVGCKAAMEARRLLWPLAAILLLTSRGLWLHEMPHPFSSEDVVLFCITVVVSSRLTSERFRAILLALSLPLFLVVLQIGSKPWSPNPFIGSNQAGYLLGIIFIFSFLSFVFSSKGKPVSFCWLGLALFSFVCIWQTNSRAALVSVVLSFLVLLLRKSRNIVDGLIRVALAFSALVAVYILRLNVFAISGIPGLKQASDLGRLEIAKCYVKLPLKTLDRLLAGFGLNSNEVFCQQLILGNPMDHAHSFLAQLWVFTGLFGVIGGFLLAWLVWRAWLLRRNRLCEFDKVFGQTALIYFICQSLVDLSMIHWPLAISMTAICVSIPLQSPSRFGDIAD